MSLKHFDLFKYWLRGLHGFSPLQDARQWMEEELPEEKSAWRRFKRVVYALFLRQLQQQLAGKQTGFLWLLSEPLIMILLFTMMHTVIRGRESSSYDIILFMGSGIVPFFLFRTILNTSLKVFKQNRSLYHFGQIQPFDAFVANIYFQTALYAIITVLLLGLAIALDIDVMPENFDLLIIMVLWLILFGISWGILFGVLNLFYEVVSRLVSFMSLPLLILSAVFYPLSSLPPIAREWLLYNPLTHFMEAIHASYVQTLDDRYVNYYYIFLWTIIPLYLGLWLYQKSYWKFLDNDLV